MRTRSDFRGRHFLRLSDADRAGIVSHDGILPAGINGFLRALVLVLALGLVLRTHLHAQAPAANAQGNVQRGGRQVRQPNAQGAQTAAENTADVAPLLRQNLPQDPLHTAIQDAVQKGMLEAKLNPAATLAIPAAAGNAVSAPNAARNVNSNNSVPQNIPPAAQNRPPAVSKASNTSQPGGTPTGPVPPLINSGIQAMVASKASLEKAGNKWGGHKQKAAALIEEALKACGQSPTPASGGTPSNPAAETPAMQAAFTQLTAAQTNFKNAKNPYGGCRDQASALVNQALSEVQAGIDFAKSHNTF